MTALMTWLVPAVGPVRDHLLATIDRLAAEHDAPQFQPHITLVPTFDSTGDAAAQMIRLIAASMPPVDVTFTAIGHEQTFFRSLYLVPEPSAQLTAQHETAQRAWALDRGWPFMPHLSLLYSDIPEEQKRPIVGTIGIALPLTVRFDAIELWAREDPEVHGWHRVARVLLSGPR